MLSFDAAHVLQAVRQGCERTDARGQSFVRNARGMGGEQRRHQVQHIVLPHQGMRLGKVENGLSLGGQNLVVLAVKAFVNGCSEAVGEKAVLCLHNAA